MQNNENAMDAVQPSEAAYERPQLVALNVDQLVRNAAGPNSDPCTCACLQNS